MLRLTRRCVSGGRLQVALTGDTEALRDARFKFDKRLVARDAAAPLRRVIPARLVARTRARRLRAVAYVRDGSPARVILSRTLPRCAR